MSCPRLKWVMCALLNSLGEGLMWVGVLFGMNSAVKAKVDVRARQRRNERELLAQESMTPLSRTELTEWAALAERMR